MIPLEVPVFSAASARIALSSGSKVGRLELNREGSYPEGGLTPTLADLDAVADAPVPLSIMIRPRGAPPPPPPLLHDFIYTAAELDQMKADIAAFKASRAMRQPPQVRHAAFVFGVLRPAAGAGAGVQIDVARNAELVRLARPFRCIFHRAFDDVLGSSGSGSDGATAMADALRDLLRCGFDGVLTAGGAGIAADNGAALARLLAAAPPGLEIIVGGGVRSANVLPLRARLAPVLLQHQGRDRLYWFHSSCLADSSRHGHVVDEDELRRLAAALS